MVSTQEAVRVIMEFLENNLDDPLNRSKKWIYDDLPRLDLSSYPRIAIVAPINNISAKGVGEIGRFNEANVRVLIYVKKKQKAEISGTTYRDVEFIDYLSNEVLNLIKDNHTHFYQNGIILVDPISENLIEMKDFYIKEIQLKTLFLR